jgi:hypothetical protein
MPRFGKVVCSTLTVDNVANIPSVAATDVVLDGSSLTTTLGDILTVAQEGVTTANSAMDRLDNIDPDLGGLITDVGDLQTTVGGHTTDIGGLQTDVGDLQTTVGGHTTDIGGLQTDVGGHTTDIGTLQSTVGGHTTDIGTLQSTVGGHTTDIGTLQSTVGGHTTDIGTLQTTYGDFTTHLGDSTVHFTEGSIHHGNILDKGTLTHTQIDKINGSLISLKNFNAVGDGIADDTVAVNAFFSALTAGNVGMGYIPTGIYKCTSNVTLTLTPVTSGAINLYGDGPYNSIISFDSGYNLTITSGTSVTGFSINDISFIANINGTVCYIPAVMRSCRFKNLRFVNNYPQIVGSVASGLQITMMGTLLENITCVGTGINYGYGLYILTSYAGEINGLRVLNCRTAVYVAGACQGCLFSNYYIEGAYFGVFLNHANCMNNTLLGGFFYNIAYGFHAPLGSYNQALYPFFSSVPTSGYVNSSTGIAMIANTAYAGTLALPTINPQGIFIGTSSSNLNTYVSTNATLTWSGALTTTFLVYIHRMGTQVTLYVPWTTSSGAINGDLISTTGLAAAYRPSTIIRQNCMTYNNTTYATGRVEISTGGIITIYRLVDGSNFTNQNIGYGFQVTFIII